MQIHPRGENVRATPEFGTRRGGRKRNIETEREREREVAINARKGQSEMVEEGTDRRGAREKGNRSELPLGGGGREGIKA